MTLFENFINKTVLIVIDIEREGQYLVVHGKDDHQLPENGDEVQEEFHTLPSYTNCRRYRPITFIASCYRAKIHKHVYVLN